MRLTTPVRWALAVAVSCLLAGVLFAAGLAVATTQGPTYFFLREIKRTLLGQNHDPLPYQRDRELLNLAFTDPMIPEQVYPPSVTLEQAKARIDGYFLSVDQFPTAFEQMNIETPALRGHVFALPYQLGGSSYTAHAYFAPRQDGARASCAALIIPGTGNDQASAIFARDATNYHYDIAGMTEAVCDTYAFVKPNHDFTAIHDGRRKLSFVAITNYLLNRGGSYSAHYVVNSLAVVKHLEASYARVAVLGLSQGGDAALLNALQSRPTAAVIASGYSVLDETLLWSNFDQIVLPGYYKNFNAKVHETIAHSPTQFLFTYGRHEGGTFKIEAEDGDTCKSFSGFANVRCRVHDAGHGFPPALVKDFLAETLTSR